MLSDIKENILKNAKAEGEASLRKAESELEADFTKIKSDGEAKVAIALQEAKTLIENEKRERLSWAKLESKRILSDAKEDAVNTVFDTLLEKMNSYTTTQQYVNKMKQMISSAVNELGGSVVVRVKNGEKRFAIPCAKIVGDADIIGGAIVESKDGKIRINLCLEELLNLQKDALRKEIYKRMFEVKMKK